LSELLGARANVWESREKRKQAKKRRDEEEE